MLISQLVNTLILVIAGGFLCFGGLIGLSRGMPKAAGGIVCGLALIVVGYNHVRYARVLCKITVRQVGVVDYLCARWISAALMAPWFIVLSLYTIWVRARSSALEAFTASTSATLTAQWNEYMRVDAYGLYILILGTAAIAANVYAMTRYYAGLRK